MSLSLRRFAAVGIGGPPDERRALARAMVAQLTTLHAPADLRVLAAVSDPDGPEWSWLKWLPHAHEPDEVDHVGPVRLMHRSIAALEDMLGSELTRRPRFNRNAEPDAELPHLVVLVDGGVPDGSEMLLDADGLQAVTVIDLDGVARDLVTDHGVELAVEPGPDAARLAVRLGDRRDPLGTADALSEPAAESLARQLAGVRLDTVSAQGEDLATLDQTLPGLLGIADPGSLDIDTLWKPRPVRDRLRVPIGITQRRLGARTRPQGGRAGRHGPARPGRRRDRFGQVRAAAHARARPRRHPQLRDRSTSSSSTSRAARRSPACRRCHTWRR